MEQVTTILDVHNLLKRFGIWVYTGDRLGDLELMTEELQELFDLGLIEQQTYLAGIMTINQEKRKRQE